MRTFKIALLSMVLLTVVSCKPSQQNVDSENRSSTSQSLTSQPPQTENEHPKQVSDSDVDCQSSQSLDDDIANDKPVRLGQVFSSACEIK